MVQSNLVTVFSTKSVKILRMERIITVAVTDEMCISADGGKIISCNFPHTLRDIVILFKLRNVH